MKRFSHQQNNFDHTLLLKTCNNHITCLNTYIAKMIIIGIDKSEISNQKRKLFQE